MTPGDPCPASDCEGHLHQLEQPNVKIYLTGQPLISATKYKRRVLRCSDCFKRFAADLPEGVKENEKFDGGRGNRALQIFGRNALLSSGENARELRRASSGVRPV